MINNRQGGRRRGRGGPRGQNLGGNRQDNRQRGNAAQLLEKYKNMARDAQLAGDRVQSEYYLQFAEHYFRVLGENRSRFDEQRKERGDESSDEDDHQSENEEELAEASNDDSDERPDRHSRGNGRDRSDRSERPDRSERTDRSERSDRHASRNSRSEGDGGVDEQRIALEALPPAIGREADDREEAADKPKRRARKPRNDGDEADIAPAA